MQNLKYLERVDDTESRFGVILNQFAMKHEEHIQLKMALSLLEYFNGGQYVSEMDVFHEGNLFYVSKEKYFIPEIKQESKVFSIRVNLEDPENIVDEKIAKMKRKINKFQNL